jgi:hypothetical protein
MMKKVIPDIDWRFTAMLGTCLFLLYFFVTFAGMYVQSPNYGYVYARLFALMASYAATLWFYLRLGRFLGKANDVESFLQIAYSRIRLIPKHLCLTLAIWTGGSISLSAIRNPIPGWFLGGILVVFPYHLLRSKKPDYSMRLLRGSYLMTMQQAYTRLMHIVQQNDELILWAGLPFPEWASAGHQMIIGAVGSGKTVLMRMLMQSTLPAIKSGSDRRAILYDAKHDALSLLAGMKVTCPIVNFNPFCPNSFAYDMAADVNSPAAALDVARTLIKREKGENSFFADAARDLLAGIIQALIIKRPREWTFAEVLQIFSNSEQTKSLLHSLPQTRHIAEEHFNRDERTLSNVQYTITANSSMLRPIAALWANSKKKISLTDWLRQESILVLGNDERLRGPMEAVNELLISRLGELVLSLNDSETRRIMLFYDEFQEGGVHRNMLRLLTQGRSKGFWALIVLHTLPGLKAVYGEDQAKAIAATCTNKAFLWSDCPDTARYAEQVLGKAELLQYTRGHADSRYAGNYSMTEHVVEKDVVTFSQLLRLPQANRERFYGYFTSPLLGVFGGPVHFSKVLSPRADVPNVKERPAEDQYIQSDPTDKSNKRASKSEINLMDIPRMTRKVLLEALNNEDSDSDYDR